MEMADNKRDGTRRIYAYCGSMLILIGFFALLVALKKTPGWDVFWPLLLMLLGSFLLCEYYVMGKGK
jgi:hypothetical protein